MRQISLAIVIVLFSALPEYGSIALAGSESDSREESMNEDSMSVGRSISQSPMITVVYDNNAYTEGLKPEWGFACVIRLTDIAILFDTGGDGAILMGNMEKLGFEPKEIDVLVLSHEHWDHVGGLQSFLDRSSDVKVYVPRSFSDRLKRDVARRGATVVEVTEPVEICAGTFLTGEMGDRIIEQSLVLRTEGGSVVITGCAHPGIVSIVEKAKEIVDDNILLAMGGFHLIEHSESQVESIIDRFRELGVIYAGPCHCTGDKARGDFRKEYGENFIEIGVGTILSVDELK